MTDAGQLSNALRITNINDFLAPTNSCVLPLGGGAVPAPATPVVAPAGSVLAPIIPTESSSAPSSVAKVTVSDCLTCSGCVTSAETVLLSTASIDKVQAHAHSKSESTLGILSVALLSRQSIASLAARYDMPMNIIASKIASFLRNCLHFDAVYDGISFAQFSVMHTTHQFFTRWERDPNNTPFLTSACPGWLTYAEKTQGKEILAQLSTVPSPQAAFAQVASTFGNENDVLMKEVENINENGNEEDNAIENKTKNDNDKDHCKLWTLSIAPCHDRKIEAVRPEFETIAPDCVITTSELETLMNDVRYSFDVLASDATAGLDSARLESNWAKYAPFKSSLESSSDGYAAHAARSAAMHLCRMSVEEAWKNVQFEKVSKSGDVTVATLSLPNPVGPNKKTKLKFATAYGFRSMQSILRKVKQRTCEYDYVELMACPGGCTNGGGQLPPPSVTEEDGSGGGGGYDRTESKKLLNRVNDHFFNDSIITTSQTSVRTLSSDTDPNFLSITSRKPDTTNLTVPATPASLDW